MSDTKERLVSCVNVAANALLAARQVIVESDDPSVYTEFAKDLRLAGLAISRMDQWLFQYNEGHRD